MGKSDSKGGTIIAVAALLVVAVLGLAWLSQPTEVRQEVEQAQAQWQGGAGDQAAAPPAVAVATERSAELELFLRAQNGGTGVSSSVLLLDPSEYAVDKDSKSVMTNGKLTGTFDPLQTRYKVMQIHNKETTGNLAGLKGFGGGTPAIISVSSGEWSEPQLTAKLNDYVLVYTYHDASPAAGDNASTANLLKLINVEESPPKWVAQTVDGNRKWDLKAYATYDWYDDTDTIRENRTYGDGGTADSNVPLTWYSRATNQGEECVDGYIYLEAPTNFTGKFTKLTISDKYGHSKEITSLAKAENYGNDDPRGIAATVLSAAGTNNYHYYVGNLRGLVTENKASEKGELTWRMEVSDTYGTDVTVVFRVVQNGGALKTTNTDFAIADQFDVQFSDGSSSGFNVAP